MRRTRTPASRISACWARRATTACSRAPDRRITASLCRPSSPGINGWRRYRATASLLLHMPPELPAHRRQQLVLEIRLAARVEALVQRGGQHRRGHGLVDRGLDGPAALAGVGDAAGELRELRIVV